MTWICTSDWTSIPIMCNTQWCSETRYLLLSVPASRHALENLRKILNFSYYTDLFVISVQYTVNCIYSLHAVKYTIFKCPKRAHKYFWIGTGKKFQNLPKSTFWFDTWGSFSCLYCGKNGTASSPVTPSKTFYIRWYILKETFVKRRAKLFVNM